MLPAKLRSPSSSARWSLLLGHLLTPWWARCCLAALWRAPFADQFPGMWSYVQAWLTSRKCSFICLAGACSNSFIDFATVFELLLWYCYSTLITDSVGASFNLGMVPIIFAWSPLFLKTKRRAHLLERQQKPYPMFAKVNTCTRSIMVGISLPGYVHKRVTNDHKLRLSPFPGSLPADSWERPLYAFVFMHRWFV